MHYTQVGLLNLKHSMASIVHLMANVVHPSVAPDVRCMAYAVHLMANAVHHKQVAPDVT